MTYISALTTQQLRLLSAWQNAHCAKQFDRWFLLFDQWEWKVVSSVYASFYQQENYLPFFIVQIQNMHHIISKSDLTQNLVRKALLRWAVVWRFKAVALLRTNSCSWVQSGLTRNQSGCDVVQAISQLWWAAELHATQSLSPLGAPSGEHICSPEGAHVVSMKVNVVNAFIV